VNRYQRVNRYQIALVLLVVLGCTSAVHGSSHVRRRFGHQLDSGEKIPSRVWAPRSGNWGRSLKAKEGPATKWDQAWDPLSEASDYAPNSNVWSLGKDFKGELNT